MAFHSVLDNALTSEQYEFANKNMSRKNCPYVEDFMLYFFFRNKKSRRKTVQQSFQMRKAAPESKDGERKREKISHKMSSNHGVAQFHEQSGVRGPTAPSVISRLIITCLLPLVQMILMSFLKKKQRNPNLTWIRLINGRKR